MANYTTGLEVALSKAGFEAQSGTPDIIISECRHFQITQLGFFAEQQKALSSFLKSIKAKAIPSFSLCEEAGSSKIARIEMSKLWIIGDFDMASVPSEFYPLDLSSSRSVLRLSGPRIDDLMARLCAVDFRDNSRNFFGASIHHCAVHIHKFERGYDIYMPRSFGESLTDYIIDISRQYHVQMAG